MQKFTHFRCVFDVSPVGDLDRPWPALVGQVRAWIEQKEGIDLKGFSHGGNWNGLKPTRAKIETRALSDGGETPAMWAVRYEHFDSALRSRRWTTDIGIAEVGVREWRLAIALNHWLRPDYVGAEPLPPEPSSPRLVTGLMEGNRWICRVGNQRLKSAPSTLQVGKGDQFVHMLRDPQRLMPVVLASCGRESGAPLIDTVRLSWSLAGTAAVFVCESPECDDELEHFLPYRFRSPNGTVRIYAPGLDIAQEWSASRHRFFPPREIESLGDEEVTLQIVRALTRTDAWRGLQASVTSVDDIEARVRERRLVELKSQLGKSQETEEFLDLQAQINDLLIAEKKALEEQLVLERGESQKVQDQLASLQYRFDELRATADKAREVARAKDEALQAFLTLDDWPTEPSAVAALAARLYGDRLILAEQGIRSLEKSAFAGGSDACVVLWGCLRAMATELHSLLMQDPPAPDVDKEFHRRTGFELTWTETKHTKRDNALMALRKLRYDGQDVDITPHVKWGNKPPKLLRVHFYVDRKNGKLVIGHCGDHLETYGTRRRGQ